MDIIDTPPSRGERRRRAVLRCWRRSCKLKFRHASVRWRGLRRTASRGRWRAWPASSSSPVTGSQRRQFQYGDWRRDAGFY